MRISCLLLLALVLVVPSAHAQNQSCETLLVSSRWQKALERLEKLQPEIFETFRNEAFELPTIEKLYLRLKAEAWTLAPNGLLPWKDRPQLADGTVERLRKEYAKQFTVETLNPDDLYLFYVNSLQSLYIYVYQTWLEEKLAQLTNNSDLSRELKNFGLAVLEKGLMTHNLLGLSVAPEFAQESLNSANFENFPWMQAMELASAWYNSDIDKNQKNRFELGDDLQSFLNTQPLYEDLSSQFKSIIEKALLAPGYEDLCCKSTPGCQFCPNNRAWLKTKSDKQ